MSGRIDIAPAGANPPQTHTVTINNPSFGSPIAIRVGDTVRWVNGDSVNHIVSSPGGGKSTFCLNGRAYVGNTPTIVGVLPSSIVVRPPEPLLKPGTGSD